MHSLFISGQGERCVPLGVAQVRIKGWGMAFIHLKSIDTSLICSDLLVGVHIINPKFKFDIELKIFRDDVQKCYV